MISRYSLFGFLLFCWACTNIEDAKPSERNTFIRFYEKAHNLYGIAAEPIENGYAILANETLANGNQNTILIRTDKTGERVADDLVLAGGSSKGMKVTSDGYYIIGDSIKLNLQSSDISVFDLVIYSARIFKLDLNGNVVKKLVIADRKDTTNLIDFHGGALTFTAQNELIALGTYKYLAGSEKPYLVAINPSTFDTLWSKNYDLIDRDYVNGKSVHATPSGKILWASALLKDNQNFSRSYLCIPYVKENSTFENFSQFGELTDQQLYANDIQPAASSAFGYGIAGTYATPTGTNGNMFFARVDQFGNIITGSELYFDGELSANNKAVAENESSSDDTGDAIISTQDGGFIIGGSMLTTPNRGKGGKDIFLVKVDGDGNVLWNKVLGGAGNETVSSIREMEDGSLLIAGSNDVSGLSSIFIMKTDKNGELNN
ncbi:MAG TPA: hypothetical protein VL443_00920 [Cyclobacteriaceae bacterium]|jgi:hypothetical protein|nr:hypothetical protein [Cyclobacteriaceae bacterium]